MPRGFPDVEHLDHAFVLAPALRATLAFRSRLTPHVRPRSPLADAFLAASEPAPDHVGAEDRAHLEACLTAVCVTARAVAPRVDVADEAFVAHLAPRVGRAVSGPADVPAIERALTQLRTADLFVALGCAMGDRSAIGVLESECIREAGKSLAKRRTPEDVVEEANQNVRERLLVGQGRPRILDYDGRGDLRSWVRVVVVREAIHVAKRRSNEVPLAYELLERPSLQDTPEAAYFRAHYRAAYKEAFEVAVGALSSRERALLRQQIVLGMNVDEIALLYDVHRATAARWVQAARDELLAKVRSNLTARLNISRADMISILRMLESQLALSMSRLLRVTEDEA